MLIGTREVRRKLRLPVGVAALVSPLLHVLNVLILPTIKGDRTDKGNVNSEITVDTRTTNANEASKSRGSPSRS